MKVINLLISITIGLTVTMLTNYAAADIRPAKIWHIEKIDTIRQSYTTETVCSNQQVPIYGQTTLQPSDGDVLLGAIIGGLFGGTISGKDEGAAIGTVLGAALAGNNNKANSSITGYTNQQVCREVNVPVSNKVTQSIVHWKRGSIRGYFYTYNHFTIGDTVYVEIN